MKDMFYAAIKKGAVGLAVLLACGINTTIAGPLDKTMGQYAVLPRSVSAGVEPMMMLAMSNDHQLYFKAYTDYDSVVGFEATKRYIGYFDNTRCYRYTGTKGAADAYFKMDKLADPAGSYCNADGTGTLWSGNFLNWATMTRIDVLRKILYGGKRTKTSYRQTILERSYLPNDAHSFAKYYNGSDLARLVPLSSISGGTGDGITFCNTTLHNTTGKGTNNTKRYSYRNDNPPLVRAIRGNYSLWASGERAQCLYRDELRAGNHGVAVSNNKVTVETLFKSFGFSPAFNSPAKPTVKNDFTVKVEACPKAIADSEALTGCKQYPNNSWRPIGVLHTHGEDDQVKFGLISGSYKENKTGGYLRKNVGFITDEINPNNGLFVTPASGESLIGHIDALRIAGWDFGSEGYRNECGYGLASFPDGKCRDWGNPLGEIMQEAYSYFAAKEAADTYTKHTGTNVIKEAGNVPAGVVKAPWNPPIKGADASKNYCAKLSVLGMNTSAQSYDNNGLTLSKATSDATPANTVLNGLTNDIGRLEGLYTGKFFVGGNGTDNNGLCTPKSLTALTSATGACPETPRLQGGWDIAGMAQYAFENDINTYDNLSKGLGRYEVEQRVQTFGIEFAAVLPKVVVGSGTKTVTIIPACQNTRGGGSGNCAIVDFKVLSKTATSGAVYINYEDSEQGGDYDQDMHGVLKYQLSASEITVTTNVIGESTPYPLAFGYVITGVTNPGFHAHSGINGYDKAECNNCRASNAESSKKYTLATSGEVTPLPSPLELATKYASAAPEASYYKSENPEKLEEGLNALFGLNGPTPAASTSGVTATTGSRGANIILHTYFAALKENNNSGTKESVTWFGSIGALFIDAEGRLREDTDGNSQLTDTDRIVKFNGDYDVRGQAQVSYETLAGAIVDKQPLESIKYVWSAADRLDKVANYTTQGTNYIQAEAGVKQRFIYTRIPKQYTKIANVVNGNLQPFVAGLFKGANADKAPLLGRVTNTDDLVNYIRGEEGITGMRNRTLTQAGTAKKYLLGDILGSSPVIVSAPSYSYDDEFGDLEYAAYKAKYKNARQVVYAAANDGMIHAFDAGTFDFATKQYNGNLGAELWAYVPFNVLPHLQWLSDPGYTHVPYVDGFLGTFDVKIFPDDAVHVGGWGTILVAGTGQGGGHFPIDTNGDGNTDVTTRPAYVILDVTDRNGPPKLMGEITHDELGFTVGEPDVIRHVDKASGTSSWHLVFGSGPRGYDDTSRRSAQLNYEITANTALANNKRRARLFSVKLTPKITNAALKVRAITNSALDSFVGGINGMDWNRDYKDDAIYFGLIEGTGQNPDGKLMRATLDFTPAAVTMTPSTMLNTNKPIIGRPTTLLDADKNYWVFAGTGRYYTSKEGDYTHNGNVYVGIKEAKGLDETPPRAAGTVTNKMFLLNDLFDTAGIQVYQDNSIGNVNFLNGTAMTSIEELRDVIANGDTSRGAAGTARKYDGWQIKLDSNERQLAEAAYSTGVLFFNSVLANPATNQQSSCDVSAAGYSYEIDFLSGVASPLSGNTNNMPKKAPDGTVVAKGVSPKTPSDGSPRPSDPKSGYKVGGDSGLKKTPSLLDPKGSSRYSWREIPLPF
ncbi:pilus assembly protein [Marinagarivorans algicola]|uniref:pilus assembly protein n=1 Tax=Marinagarivorans algicola TaxID=1513270 RepID=UPI0006B8F4A1|nr:PilC/PilY family type IV pilus protein [Marinagarivorans algicola]